MKILIINDREPLNRDLLQPLCAQHDVVICEAAPNQFDLKATLKNNSDATVLVSGYANLDAEHLRLMPELQTVVTTTTATEYVDHSYCAEKNITLYNNSGYTGSAVAEHLFALMMASARRLVTLDRELRQGDFDQFDQMGFELAGKTVGILGMGHIGQCFARLLQGFSVTVQFYNRSSLDLGYKQCDLVDCLKTSDVIAVTLPLTDQTRHSLDRAALAQLKRGALLVSIAADEVVEQSALVEALQTGQLAAAGLDLHEPQPALSVLPNVTLTPTKAWYTKECYLRRQQSWMTALMSTVSDN